MPKYNRKLEVIDGELHETWTNRSGTETHGRQLSGEEDDYDIGAGCAACGNPAYPNCMDSCPLCDD